MISTAALLLFILGLLIREPGAFAGIAYGALALQGHFAHRVEEVVNVLALLGTDQLQDSSQSSGILLDVRVVDLFLVAAVDFVAHHRQHDVLRPVCLQLLHPLLHHFEAALGSDIVDAEGDLGFAVVDGSDRAVLLLTGRVPNLCGQWRTWNSMRRLLGRVCFLVRNAAPRVGSLQSLNFSQVKRVRMEVLPTPESPTAISFSCVISLCSYSTFDMIKSQQQSPYLMIMRSSRTLILRLNQQPIKSQMEYVFASDHLRNPYFDRIVQTAVEVEVGQMAFCLQQCRMAQPGPQNSSLSLTQRLCLQDCAKLISVDITEELATRNSSS